MFATGETQPANFPGGQGNDDNNRTASTDSIREGNDNVNRYSLEEAEDLKQRQFQIIQRSHPAADDYHTWIRSADEIRTFEEAVGEPEWAEYGDFTPDYTQEMAETARERGTITVYSAYPIEAGVFVTPSRMEAESYAGGGRVYSRKVKLEDVAWIDPIEGQFAKGTERGNRYSLEDADYTIERNEDGHVTVRINSDVLENKSRSEWKKVVEETLKQIFDGGISIARGEVFLNKRGRGEFTNGSYSRMLERTDPALHEAKMKMAPGTGAMVENAENVSFETPRHARTDDIVGFNKGNIRVIVSGKGYTGDVITAVYSDGKEVFFDVNNLAREEDETLPMRYAAGTSGFSQTDRVSNKAVASLEGVPSKTSIDSDDENVNWYSLEDGEEAEDRREKLERLMHEYERETDAELPPAPESWHQEEIDEIPSPSPAPEPETDGRLHLPPPPGTEEENARETRQRELERAARRLEKREGRRKSAAGKLRSHPEYDPLAEFRDREDPVKAYIQAAQARAAAAKTEAAARADRETFTATPSLEKLGVRIEGSVGNYAQASQLVAREKAAFQLRKQIRRREAQLSATAKEKEFAAGIAAGIYTAEDVPATLDRAKVEELSDYYWAEKAVASDMIAQRRKDINLGLDEEMEGLLQDSELYKVPKAIVLNYRTPERLCKTIWGDEHGQAVYDAVFRPVAANEAEKTRFINRMFERVRRFEGADGKSSELTKEERMLTQQVLEGRAVEELAASMEMRESIENAAESIRAGTDAGDAAREWGLTENEKGIAEQYARWLVTKEAYESGNVDSVKIDNAVKTYSELYNQMYDAINDFLAAHGYDPIGFIKGYAPHMQMGEDLNLFAGYLERLGFNTNVTRLPASIAGKTADYKPNKRWNPYFLTRSGDMTDFDIAKGFESYVNYLSDVLYHTDDIMRVRAMSRYYRRTFAPDEVRETLDWIHNNENASTEVKEEILKDRGILSRESNLAPRDIQAQFDEWTDRQYEYTQNMTKYADYVSYLDNYANILAGKQSSIDRGAEALLGRESLNWGNKLVNSFQRTQVAANLSSALNQSAQLPQIFAELGSKYTAKAAADIASGKLRQAGWAQESDFLTGKRGVDMLVTDAFDMLMSKAFAPATAADGFISTVAVRGKYLQEIEAGKSHKEAMRAADDFGRRIMGSRMKGEKPTAFHAKRPVAQMLNMFQIEALNSWEHLSRDLPEDFRRIEKAQGTRAASFALAGVIVKTLLSAFLLNRLGEELYGGTPAPFDLLGLSANFIASGQGLTTNRWLKKVIDDGLEKLGAGRALGTEEDEGSDSFDFSAATEDLWYNVSNDIPFLRNIAGLMGWGDQTLPLPLMGAGQDLQYLLSDLGEDLQNRRLSGETGMDVLRLASQLLPGGRQLTKTAEGLQLMAQGGRMVNGRLYYPVENSLSNWITALLFGKSALYESNAYYAGSGTKLNERQTGFYQRAVDAGADGFALYQAIQDYKAVESDGALGSFEKGRRQREIITRTELSDGEKLELFRAMEPGSENRATDFEELMGEGLSWAEVIQAYDRWAELNASEDMKTTAKAEAWAAWVAGQDLTGDEKAALREHFQFWQSIPVETTKVDKFTEAGMEADEAQKLAETLRNLQPLPGSDKVTDLQKYQAIAESGLSVEEQWTAIEAQTPSSYTSTLDKIEIMRARGITPAIWTESKAAMYAADDLANDDGRTSQGEAKQALDGMNVSNEIKAVLWQLTNKSWKARANPYSREIGQAVYDQLHSTASSSTAEPGLSLPPPPALTNSGKSTGGLTLPPPPGR